MPDWLPYVIVALAVGALLARHHLRRAPKRGASAGDQAFSAVVARVADPPEAAPRPTPLDAEKRRLRGEEGGRVRLRGAVVGGALDRGALQTILIERQNPGEQAKAIRVLLRFFSLPEAIPVLLRALDAHGPDFLALARFSFGSCGVAQELPAATASVGTEDEPWLLGALLFADPFSQRVLCEALARVGGRRTLDALTALADGRSATPWVQSARDAVRSRLAQERAGGLAIAASAGASGGLSTAAPTDDSPTR